ncbi:mediator of RNA polymerase II transcription subunit 1-domain-containing protein [Scheffersomyces coipomensis]|uniref:mediator of RNA polymerase II transcription subunit 1-domain-containing protein n=1 Tax=Scheffersomyces coipomensis TaxID=1788519 RepID=UPI00315C93E6
MPSSNGVLNKALGSLFDYSSNFKLSIELIQKLAQQLKLETFVDNLRYTVETNNSIAKDDKTQRLTIAGSYILIDIDFIDDNRVVDVSISFANQAAEAIKSLEHNLHGRIKSNKIDNNGITQVIIESSLDLSEYNKLTSKDEKSMSEKILLHNLSSKKLNQFPINLNYLSNIDRLTSSSFDAFNVLEKLSSLLYVVSSIESEGQLQDWLVQEGYKGRVGQVKVNDLETNQLGIFINFWKDYRYINHEYEVNHNSKELLLGNKYNFLIHMNVSKAYRQQIDYFDNLTHESWQLFTGEQPQPQSYQFQFEQDNSSQPPPSSSSSSSSSSTDSSDWRLSLTLNHEIYIPQFILEYLGLLHHTQGDSIKNSSIISFNNHEDVLYDLKGLKDTQMPFKIINNLISNQFIPLKSISVNKLSDISILIPIFRNFIVFINLLNTIEIRNKESFSHDRSSIARSRRNSKVGSMSGLNPEKELTEEAKKKLKESLKLPQDVTDEELLSLNAMSENATYSTIKPISHKETNLEAFLKDHSKKEGDSESGLEISNQEKAEYISLTLEDIDLTSPFFDLILSFEVISKLGEVYVKFKISNGEIIELKDGNENMEVDNNDKSTRFIKGLNLTEDVTKSFTYVYL